MPAVLAPGLPALTGSFYDNATPSNGEGAFNNTFELSQTGVVQRGTGYDRYKIIFDAQKSNALYGAANTVQPPALCLIPQIKF